ncbi:MAG TPA: hypothetical protein VGM86_17030 [Thermoanaerobaculia bacterium]|jgi:hypothetical protein
MASQIKKNKATGSKGKPARAIAFHAESEDGEEHVVGIGNLRVMLFNDSGSWFAQGLEIDYFAEGTSLEDVKDRFRNGLVATIDYHLKLYGDIGGVLQVAPPEVWKEFLSGTVSLKRYSQVSLHERQEDALSILPFAGVDFYEKAAA